MRSPLLAGILLISLILACAIGVVFLMRTTASSAPVEALPRDTSFLVRVQNPAEWRRDLARTALAPSGDDPTAPTVEWISRFLESRGIALPAGAMTYLQSTDREILLAQVPGDADTPAGRILVLDLGSASHVWLQEARRTLEPAATWSPRTHRGREYLTCHAGGANFHVAAAKGLGIITTTGAVMRRVLDTLDGRADALGAEPAYRVTRDRLGRRAGLLAWMSGSWAAERLEERFPEASERRVLRLMGLGAATGVGLEVDIRAGLFLERLFVAMRGERRGLPAELMAGPALPHQASRVVPASMPFYLSLSCSHLDAVYRRLPEVLASTTGGDRRELRSRLEGAEQFMALDLASGLFAAFGDEMVVGFGRDSDWPRGATDRRMLQTPMVASISVANRSRLGRFLDRMDGLARALASYETIARDGRTMTSYNIAALAPMRPAYQLTQGRLTAATSPELLTSALDAGARHESWADLPGIDDLLGRLPDRSHAMLVADSGRVAEFLGVVERKDFPAGSRAFRGFTAGGLPPIAIAARMSSSGLQLDTIAPVSPALMLALSLLAGDPSWERREDAPRPGVEETIPY